MIRASILRKSPFNGQAVFKTAPRVLFSTTRSRSNNTEDIEKVKVLIEQKMFELKKAQEKRLEEDKKPKLSDFTRPLITTLMVGSITYLSFHWLWWYLEYDEREEALKVKLNQKEEELSAVLALNQLEESKPNSGKKSWLRFWRTN